MASASKPTRPSASMASGWARITTRARIYRLGQLVFAHVPFPQVPAILSDALERAMAIGDRWTLGDVLSRGQRHGMRG